MKFPQSTWAHRAPVFLCVTLLLLSGAIANGFPLIFPDTGPYLGAAYADAFPHDRSGFYPIALLPVLKLVDGVPGLWVAIIVQATVIAAVLIAALRKLAPQLPRRVEVALVALLAIGTALPWHAGQLMPDAFTGAVVLLAWLAVLREPTAAGSPLLWFAAVLATVVHATHIAILASTVVMALAVHWAMGHRKLLGRAIAGTLAIGTAAGLQIAANGLNLGLWSISSTGPVFLFARLNEDGLMALWAEKHCQPAATSPVCALQALAPRDSQLALWQIDSPINARVWFATPAERARWVADIAVANRQAIIENPGAFARNALRAGGAQLVTFGTLDDMCPEICSDLNSNPLYTVRTYRPDLLAAFAASRQVRGKLPKQLIRAATLPATVIGLLLLLPALALAWRKRDAEAAAFLAATSVAIIINAFIAGALSDVHERYQSRIVWLAPFAVLAVIARWNGATRALANSPRSNDRRAGAE